MKIIVPFIKSREFECGQACAAMMIKYFKPEFEPDFDKFNNIIHHRQGMNTFPPQNAILLDHYSIKSMSFSSDTISKSEEDPNQFKRWFGKDYEYEIRFVDIENFDWMVEEFRKKNLFTQKITEFDELLAFFKKGYLVCIPINWNVLNNRGGPYEGHFVIITGIEKDKIFIHDPDIGPFLEYPLEKLKKSWDMPPVADDYFIAYRKK